MGAPAAWEGPVTGSSPEEASGAPCSTCAAPVVGELGHALASVANLAAGVVFYPYSLVESVKGALSGTDFVGDPMSKLAIALGAVPVVGKGARVAERAVSALSKEVRWTAHGGKHAASAKVPWSDVVAGTRTGPAKYMHSADIEKLERRAWTEGTAVTAPRPWKVMQFSHEVGASGGKSSRWVRVEESGGTIHGHPITEAEFAKLTRPR